MIEKLSLCGSILPFEDDSVACEEYAGHADMHRNHVYGHWNRVGEKNVPLTEAQTYRKVKEIAQNGELNAIEAFEEIQRLFIALDNTVAKRISF